MARRSNGVGRQGRSASARSSLRRLASAGVLAIGCAAPAPAFPPASEDTDDGTAGASSSSSIPGGVETSDASTDDGRPDESGSDTTGDPPAVCGDGMVDGDEECDQGAENGMGNACRDDCRLNTCPDGYVGPGEACDDGNVNDADRCTNACGPPSCGDGVVQGDVGEECDDGVDNSPTGSCLPTCLLAICGDEAIRAGVEACDGRELNGETCASQGFDAGVLSCSRRCTYDTSNCAECGDGVAQAGEQCDGMDFDGNTCVSLGYGGGTLSCTPGCMVSIVNCCVGPGDQCMINGQCCSGLSCSGGTCCIAAGGACMTGNDCCSGSCSAITQHCLNG